MVNSYDIAILSEKVARLEALLAAGGVSLPEVSASDNGATLQVVNGAWAKGDEIPSIINALDSTSTTDGLSAAQGKALDDKIKVNTITLESISTTVLYANAYNINNLVIIEFALYGASANDVLFSVPVNYLPTSDAITSQWLPTDASTNGSKTFTLNHTSGEVTCNAAVFRGTVYMIYTI